MTMQKKRKKKKRHVSAANIKSRPLCVACAIKRREGSRKKKVQAAPIVRVLKGKREENNIFKKTEIFF